MKPTEKNEDTVSPNIHTMGKGYELIQSQRFDQPVEKLFEYFADPHNLETITPPWLNFNMTFCEHSPVREGTEIQYTLSLHGVPVSWTTRIKKIVENEFFVDEMVDGPYKVWEHVHTFEEIQGETVMGDQVYYEMPYGWLGKLTNTLLVKRDLRRIFSYRARTLREVFGPDD